MRRDPNWMEKAKRLLGLLGKLVVLIGQVVTLYEKFFK